MDRQGFSQASPGRLVATIGGRKAFVPNPLPPANLDIGAIADVLADAAGIVGELNGIGRTVPNPYLLVRPLQRREAVSSSAMEGTYTTLPELLLLEAGAPETGRAPDTREVANYVRALEHGVARLPDFPLSERLIREMHEHLLHGVARHRGGLARPGEFKRDQNWIGGGRDIAAARFIPPPRDEAIAGLGDLMRYLHREDRHRAPALVDAALMHYQFETLHPFDDGNGRIGRMLITLILIERGALVQPMLYLSPAFERRKDQYIDLLYAVSRDGAWLPWVNFFLETVIEAAHEAVVVSDRLLTLQRDYRLRFQTARSSALLLRMIDVAFERPAWTIRGLAAALGISYQGAANNVRQLIDAGVAYDHPDIYPRTIIFPEIIEALLFDQGTV